MGNYTEGNINTMLDGFKDDWTELYNDRLIRLTKESREYYETVARLILERLNNKEYIIKPICRKESYHIADHIIENVEKEKRSLIKNKNYDYNNENPVGYNKEKRDARYQYYGKTLQNIGEIIDYETPLYTSGARARRAIDLLAYNKEKKVVTILEYKVKKSPEPLLRCVLEAYTYFKLVEMNKEKFLDDFSEPPYEVSKKSSLQTAVFLYKDTSQFEYFNHSKDSEIRKLMRALKIDFYVIDDECLLKA